jgi:hypothetical protein
MLAGTPNMKKYRGIRYGFRPASYWSETDPLTAILRNVTGENRRPFTRLASAPYRELEGHFAPVFAAWVTETRADRDEAAALKEGGAA